MTVPIPNAEVYQITILVDGTALSKATMNKLVDAEVESTLYVPGMFVLRFHDEDLSLVDGAAFALGKPVEIKVQISSQAGFVSLFKGEITAIEPEYTEDFLMILAVRGFDKMHRLNRGTKSRAFLSVTDSDVVSKICGEAGLSAEVTATSTVHPHIIQDNQSNLAFLQGLARRNGYQLYVNDTKLIFKSASALGSGRQTVALEWGKTLRSFRPRASLANQINEVTAKTWDPKQKQAVVGLKTSSSAGPQVGLGGTGGALAQTSFSSAKALEAPQPAVVVQTDVETLAQSMLDEVQADFVQAEGVAVGQPTILAGCKVTLTKLGTKFSGTYLVTTARHIYSGGDYKTEFSVEGLRPNLMSSLLGAREAEAAPNIPRWMGVVPAIITANSNDPDGYHRVKVKYPWLDDSLESNWIRIAAPGAGPQRGLFWMPEVNDEVLVAFENGFFDRPYVIGGLWNGTEKPPETTPVEGGKVEVRTLKTRAGHTIRLTDRSGQEKIEIIDSKTNTSLTMDTANKAITVNSKGNITVKSTEQGNIMLEATQGNVTVQTSSGNINVQSKTGNVTVEAVAGNMTVKSSGPLTVESTATATLKANGSVTVQASGMVEIKGSLVKIN